MLQQSIFDQINPIYYWKKFNNKQTRIKFPVNCPLSKTQIKLPVVNMECESNCYFSFEEIKKFLKNEKVPYTCPSCGLKVHSRNIIYDCGYEVVLSRFDQIKNKNTTYEYLYLDNDGYISFEDKTPIIPQIFETIDNKRIQLLGEFFKQDNNGKTIQINKNNILEDISSLSKQYFLKVEPKNFLFTRGKKTNNSTQFSTIFFYSQTAQFHMRLSLKQKPFILTKQSEIRFVPKQSAFFIISNQARKLNILKGQIKNINYDIIEFKELAILPARSFFGVTNDSKYLYIVGGSQNSKILKQVTRIDCETGASFNLPDMLIQRCGVKAEIVNNKLYVIGGGNRNNYAPFTPVLFAEYFDFKQNVWKKIESKMQGFNFGIVVCNDQKTLIVYGGCSDGNNDKRLKYYYHFDTNTNTVTYENLFVEDYIKWQFDFDNQNHNQTLVRHLLVNGRQSDVTVLNFYDKKYKIKKFNID